MYHIGNVPPQVPCHNFYIRHRILAPFDMSFHSIGLLCDIPDLYLDFRLEAVKKDALTRPSCGKIDGSLDFGGLASGDLLTLFTL